QLAGARAAAAVAGELHRQEHVLLGRQRRNQVVALKHEADLAPPHLRHLIFAEVRDVLAIENHLAGGRRIESGEQTEQRALAAARRSHDGGELAARNREVDALEDVDTVRAGVDGFGERANFDQPFIMAVEMRRFWWFAVAVILTGCSSKEEPAPRASTPPPATAPSTPADPRPAIVCFGDSITAGFGLEPGQGYPELLQKDLDTRGLRYRVVNMGVSGDTTQDGVSRMQLALSEKPAVVLLELGGNDGLRGIPINVTQSNLEQMIQAFQGAGTR